MENREYPRSKSYIGAKIVFNDGRSVFDCVVKDISKIGARLAVWDALSIPDAFRLKLSDGRNFSAVVRWRRINSIGVSLSIDFGQGEKERVR